MYVVLLPGTASAEAKEPVANRQPSVRVNVDSLNMVFYSTPLKFCTPNFFWTLDVYFLVAYHCTPMGLLELRRAASSTARSTNCF